MLEIIKDKKIFEVFGNISDLVDYIQDDSNKKSGRDNSSITNDYGFTGTHSYEEAVEKLKYGDEELYREIVKEQRKLKVDKILGNIVKKKKSFNDIVGYQANVPLYLNGVPTNMINDEKLNTDGKILNIFLSISVSAWYNANDIKKVGVVYASIIDILEKLGYRINLYAGNVSSCGSEYIYYLVKVKTDREPLNIKKLSFVMAHPSMLRRIGFRIIEYAPTETDFTDNGYGRPVKEDEFIEEELYNKLKTKFLVFSYQNDMGVDIKRALENLKEKGIKLEGYNEDKM